MTTLSDPRSLPSCTDPGGSTGFTSGEGLLKRCTKCQVEKPVALFSRTRRAKDGYNWWCKDCYDLYRRENRARLSAYRKKYAQDHPELLRKQKQADYQKHRSQVRAHQREYRLQHPVALAIGKRREYREHRERYKRRAKKWATEHPALVRAYGLSGKARRKKARGTGYTKAHHIRARSAMYGNRCWICGDPSEATDHVKPLAKGGAHWPCNLRPICNTCNSLKHSKWYGSQLLSWLQQETKTKKQEKQEIEETQKHDTSTRNEDRRS